MYRANLAKLEEQAVKAAQAVKEAAQQEQEAAAALEKGEEKLRSLKAQQEELKALVEREAQDAQVMNTLHLLSLILEVSLCLLSWLGPLVLILTLWA